MDAIFYSEKQAYLKVNGEFFGEVDANLKTANISDKCLLEFLPKNQNYAPAYSSENGSFLVKKYAFYSNVFYAVKYEKKRTFPYKILSQRTFYLGGQNYYLTVLLDGAIKFYIDGYILATDELPFVPTESKLEYFNGYLFAVFKREKTAVYTYRLDGATLCYKNEVDYYEIDGRFNVKTVYSNVLDVQIEESYLLKDSFLLESRSAKKGKTAFEINKNLVPLLFFDLILNGVDASEILTQNLSSKQLELREFIGSVERAFLNPYALNEVIALYDNKLLVYEFETVNGVISNVIEKD